MQRRCADVAADDELLELPALDEEGAEDDEGGADPSPEGLELPALDGDTTDDEAPEAPFELDEPPDEEEPSALGDDETGPADHGADLGISVADRGPSLLGPDDELGCDDDDSLGIEELDQGDDQGDAEGLEDLGADLIDAALPALDGSDDDDDEELDVGIELPSPPPEQD